MPTPVSRPDEVDDGGLVPRETPRPEGRFRDTGQPGRTWPARHDAVMTVEQVPLFGLVQGPIREGRPHLDADRVAYYLDHLDEAPPVTVFDIDGHLLLADGHHRLEAARRLGRDEIRADVRPGTRHDALQFAVESARQQHELSEEEVRAAIGRRGYREDLELERCVGDALDPGDGTADQRP